MKIITPVAFLIASIAVSALTISLPIHKQVKQLKMDTWRFDKMKNYSYMEIKSEIDPVWKIRNRKLKRK